MPALTRRTPSPTSSSSDESIDPAHFLVNNEEYAANFDSRYSEKPLDEQLEPIAVVGMGCRLPGNVSSPAQFWDMMMNKRSGRTARVPDSRFNIDAYLHPNNERPGSFNVPGGYFLNSSLQEFDPQLFNISPIEAMWMDPQQRKLLEVVYEALESGGIPLVKIEKTKTAVFVGSFTSDFQQMSFKEPDFRHSYAATGVDPGMIANRISHVFNLSGPSITVNTACSSSIYAMHNACSALRNHECSGAIVSGTNLVLTVDQHMNTAKLGVLSPDSTCHTFDASANGYGRADGVGAVYLKRLTDALRDGDPIRGVIRSSAVNSNGKVPGLGITYPNKEGQAEAIRHAYARGGDLEPRLTGYFECHGTGTPVGDPIEVHAVAQAMQKEGITRTGDPHTDALWIGAAKTNIGHSEAASGLSAIIKAILVVEKGIIPPIQSLETPNPNIDWKDWNIKVPTKPEPFPAHLPVRRVSVNSFGYGGTNGHFIVEGTQSLVPEYTHGQKRGRGSNRSLYEQKRPYLLPFSAHDRPTLVRNIEAYAKIASDYNLLDLSYTLANRRSRLASRAFAVCSPSSTSNAFSNITENFSFAEKKKTPVIGFVFTGQGAQWARMCCELMEYHPRFLTTIRKLDRTLGDLPDGPDWTLEDVLREDKTVTRVNEAEFAQPLCTAIQIALVDLLEYWGITPKVVVGHSSGEIAASYAAGLVSFDDAIIASYYRGRVVKGIETNGAMMAVGLSAESVYPYLHGLERQVVVACDNSPALVTLSGDAEALGVVKQRLDKDEIFARLVSTGGKAYHSFHMKPAAKTYHSLMAESLSHVTASTRKPSGAVMISSVTNTVLDPRTPLDAAYWCANLISPVKFNQAIQKIASEAAVKDVNLLIEIGPHSALKGPINQICREYKMDQMSYLSSLERHKNSAVQVLALAGELFLRDVDLEYERITAIGDTTTIGHNKLINGKLIVDLPTYQWNYAKDLWAESRHSVEHRALKHLRHDTLGSLVPGGPKTVPTWRNYLRTADLPWLKHHSLGGDIIFPAAGYFSMAVEAITQLHEGSRSSTEILGYTLRDISIKSALIIPDDNNPIETLFTMQPSAFSDVGGTAWWDFTVSSCLHGDNWNSHMTGTIAFSTLKREKPRVVPDMSQRAIGKTWNEALRSVGFDYGPSFQDMQNIRSDGRNYHAAASTVIKTESGIMQGESRYALHPAAIDSCLQLIIVSIYAGKIQDMVCGAVPIDVEEVSIWPPTAAQLADPAAKAYSWTDERGMRHFHSGTQLVGSDGELTLSIKGMRCVSYEAAVPQNIGATVGSQPYMQLTWGIDIDTLTSASPTKNLTIRDVIALAGFKRPGTRVLDIGGVDAASVCKAATLIEYTGTASTDDALNALQHSIEGQSHSVALKLDPTLPLEEQGIQQGAFDVIIPGNLADPAKLRWLLAPGGYLIFNSKDSAPLDSTFTYVHLASGTTIAKLRQEDDDALISSNGTVVNGHAARSVVIVYRNEISEIPKKLAKLTNFIGNVRFMPLAKAEFASREHVIIACDLETPILIDLAREELVSLQIMVSTVSTVTWISAGGLMKGVSPDQAMAVGLARSIRSEVASVDFTTIDINPSHTSADTAANEIFRILQRHIEGTKGNESEYCIEGGLVYINRLLPHENLNQQYGPQSVAARAVPFSQSDPQVGLPQASKLIFQHDERAAQAIRNHEVQVRVLMSHLGKEDVLIHEGSDYPTTFSHEIYGEIAQKGSAVKDLEVGDRVFGYSCDRLATFQTVSADMVQQVSKTDVPEEAVTMPMAYAAAIHGLETLARVDPGEVVLILHGTGTAGAAASVISKLAKAQTFVAVKSPQDVAQVATALNLPQGNVISSCDSTVMAQLRSLTGGRPADIVFSSSYVAPSTARECWRQIAPFGRFIATGMKNTAKYDALDLVPTQRGASYIAFDILNLLNRKPQLLSSYLRRTASIYRQVKIPAIQSVQKRNISEYENALSEFTDDFNTPRTVIEYSESKGFINRLPRRTQISFRPNATYFLVGCLGGLGRSLATWMVQRGAKRLAFMSRSGSSNRETGKWLRELEDTGVTCQIIKGDVSKVDDVKAALNAIPSSHPVRGVVHAAMVLCDDMFHSMSHESWEISIRPKVFGAINLHNALSEVDLDFMVFTSSTSGVLGTPGQTNYSAANNFLDSLARHRVANEKPGSSLILPMVNNVGVVAENPEIETALRRKGIYGIDETHLLESFEAAMLGGSSNPRFDHIVVGFDPSRLKDSLSGNDVTDTTWTEDARFSAIIRSASDSSSQNKNTSNLSILKAIHGAESFQAAVDLVIEHFTTKLCQLLLLESDIFDAETLPISDYGLDSMIGAELRNWIFKNYELDIPFQKLNGPDLTITKFAALVCVNQGLE